MKAREPVHSLEQQESGEMRRLSCAVCGRRSFTSARDLALHENRCNGAAPPSDLQRLQ